MEKIKNNKIISIRNNKNKKHNPDKIVKDYLKPSCEEELTQDEYPKIIKE